MFTLVITFGLVVLVGYWLFHSYTPIKFNNNPFPVENTTVKVGDYLIYDVDYCKYNTLLPTATKTFVDSLIFEVPAETVAPKAVGCKVIQVNTQVPTALPAGKYVLKITYSYQVNPIKKVDIMTETQGFTIIR